MSRVILANAGAMAGTSAVTSGLGYLFWLLAARTYQPEAVGLAAAAVSAMLLLGNLAATGLGTMLIGELPRHRGEEGDLIVTAVAAAGGLGLLLGLAFAVLSPRISPSLQFAGVGAGAVALFAVGVSLTAVGLVGDQALIGLLRGDLQFGRNALFAGAKLAALAIAAFALGPHWATTVYAAWAAGNVVSLGALAVALAKRPLAPRGRPRWKLLHSLGRPALAHHALNMALALPTMTLPLIVTAGLSATTNAYFYTAAMIAGFAAVGPPALTTALYAAGARQPEDLARHMRFTLAINLLMGVLATGAVIVAGGTVLRFFGARYAEVAWASLVLLTLGVFPLTVKHHYVAVCRVRNAIPEAAALMTVGAILELAAAGIGGKVGGLNGLSLSWLIALCVEAAYVAPRVVTAAALFPVAHAPGRRDSYASVIERSGPV